MKQKIDNILSFAKNEPEKEMTYSFWYSLDESNEIVISSLYKSEKGKAFPNIFFRDYSNPYEPTDEELSTAVKKYIDNGGEVKLS